METIATRRAIAYTIGIKSAIPAGVEDVNRFLAERQRRNNLERSTNQRFGGINPPNEKPYRR